MFGIMPGALGDEGVFGATLVSVLVPGAGEGRSRHQGVVVLFNGSTSAPLCVADAEEITTIRTAAASAVATDALARRDATRLALIGTGTQALAHARAIVAIRPITAITLWGRSSDRAETFAQQLRAELGLPVEVGGSVAAAVARADIICTLTGARDPILFRRDVPPGAHLNIVGSSVAAAAEIDGELVAAARFVADYAEGIRAQGGEWRRALAAGLVTEEHLVGEIGQILLGRMAGREHDDQITIYKSIGHVVQDLAAAHAGYEATC